MNWNTQMFLALFIIWHENEKQTRKEQDALNVLPFIDSSFNSIMALMWVSIRG
jgi:hypothetical protein